MASRALSVWFTEVYVARWLETASWGKTRTVKVVTMAKLLLPPRRAK